MEQKEAVEIFMERIAFRAYRAALDEMSSLLTRGPVGKKPNLEDVELHHWYGTLDAKDKSMLERTIKDTAYRVLFGFLVILDNRSMGYPIEGVLSDLAVYIQSYSNPESLSNNQPSQAIRINHPKNKFDLHDLIMKYIE